MEQSFASSLEHLGTDTIDSYVLHGPSQRAGLAAADWAAWSAMEALHDAGHVRFLGVSNVTLEQLQTLCEKARIRPRFVQNRCYAIRGWDRRVREFCTANDIVYQGFSLLTANREVLASPAMAQIAQRHGRTVSQIVFRFALDVGMIALTGQPPIRITCSRSRMSSISISRPTTSRGSRRWRQREPSRLPLVGNGD